MRGIPVIKISIEHMTQSIMHAFSQQMFDTDQYVQEEVKRYCSEDNLRAVVSTAARNAIDAAVKKEVETFFRYGVGADIVKKAVIRRLEEDTKHLEDAHD